MWRVGHADAAEVLFDLNTDGFDLDLIGFTLNDLAQFSISEGEASEGDFDIDKAIEDIKGTGS